jgi:hypothetical protein
MPTAERREKVSHAGPAVRWRAMPANHAHAEGACSCSISGQ